MNKEPARPRDYPAGRSLRRQIRDFRADLFAALPSRLYRAWMAEKRNPFYSSYIINQPDLVKTILQDRPEDFPKSPIIHDTLRALLGDSVFVTNGAKWAAQRRIIDPAFEGGNLRSTFPAMQDAGRAALARLTPGQVEMEFETAHLAADVIFRTLFSTAIDTDDATAVFNAFRAYQRAQPLWNLPGLLRLPGWVPRFHSKTSRQAAVEVRRILLKFVDAHAARIAAGDIPQDLAGKIMTTPDPETGVCFSAQEMVDQVAIFFLAGHETSASALSWALYLLALYPDAQRRVATEAQAVDPATMAFSNLSKLAFTRDVFRETLRLYPPVPMMVRQTVQAEPFRDRVLKKGALAILSPWHLHRHERLWDNPHGFDPGRWKTDNGKACQRNAFIPFSAGPRVCTGAGFAMVEGVLLLAMLVARWEFRLIEGRHPQPVAHLTVRAADGVWLELIPRAEASGGDI
jgi:cytochrome P450